MVKIIPYHDEPRPDEYARTHESRGCVAKRWDADASARGDNAAAVSSANAAADATATSAG